MPLDLKALSQNVKHAEELIEYSWLNLEDIGEIPTHNPLDRRTEFDRENPHLFILDLMRRPEYFGFTCKHLFNIELLPFQLAILKEMWVKTFIILIASRGGSKSWLLALYSLLRATFSQGSKVVVVGAGFRQAKNVFEYAESMYRSAPIFQDLLGHDRRYEPKRDTDRCTIRIGESLITALPTGDGQKIRGTRASHLIAEEFGSINKTIYEEVISPFSSVKASPVVAVKEKSRHELLTKLGVIDEDFQFSSQANQQILSGTADYEFNHFYNYWKSHKEIILNKGDVTKLKENESEEATKLVQQGLDWKKFTVIRIPVELLPKGMMDESNVARAQATQGSSTFQKEYGTCFLSDSDGFFKRSLIERCVVGRPHNPISFPSAENINFSATLYGLSNKQYIYGIDPASERDNFTICILERHPDHRRIVYFWSIRRDKYKERLKQNPKIENDFFYYCARKIIDLNKVFPAHRIGIDSQGGGFIVREALGNRRILEEGEMPIHLVYEAEKDNPTDNIAGLKVIEMINFADAQWTSTANYGMKADFEGRILLFPYFDPVSIEMAGMADDIAKRNVEDSLEDVVTEIEELKDELATIVCTQTPQGNREHWDTPKLKTGSGIQTRGALRKDRYSALLIANMVCRTIDNIIPSPKYKEYGTSTVSVGKSKNKHLPDYVGPNWFTNPETGIAETGMVIRRK